MAKEKVKVSAQKHAEAALHKIMQGFYSASSVSLSIIGLLPEQYNAIDAPEFKSENGTKRSFKMKMVGTGWVHYHQRAEEDVE